MKRLLVIYVLCLILVGCKDDEEVNQLVESIEVYGEDIDEGTTRQMTAVVLPESAYNKIVEWSVSDTETATVSQTGLLTALKNGSVLVTASATDGSGVKGSKTISISSVGTDRENIDVEQITISGPAEIANGAPAQYEAEVMPETATSKEVEWSVSDESLASISPTGLLTPLANGSVTITATASDGSGVTGEMEVVISGFDSWTTVTNPAELLEAINNASPGDSIRVAGGTYEMTNRINIKTSGTAEEKILLFGDANDRPLLDFSAFPEGSSNKGIVLEADHWYIKGLDIFKAGDNGMQITGNDNLIEFCTFSECADTGLQIDNGASDNTILNCDSYFNADASVENADGFAAKLGVGTGNKFIGCRAWNNLDDGWDGYLRGADNVLTIHENCWAIRNGYLKDGSRGGGDGNGFKTGGSDDKQLKHNALYKNCLAVGNKVDGFDHNSNRGEVTMYNCLAYDNNTNLGFSNTNPLEMLTIKNTAVLGNVGSTNATSTDVTHNSWQNDLSVSEADFRSLDVEELLAPRKPDGSLPDVSFMHLTSDSDLIDAGVDVGLEFNGEAPDIGAFEYQP